MNEELLAMAKEAGFKIILNEASILHNNRQISVNEKLTKFAELLQAEMVKSAEPVAWRLTHFDGSYEIVTTESWQKVKVSEPLYLAQPNAAAQIAELKAKLDEANAVPNDVRKDAERYRWLSENADSEEHCAIHSFIANNLFDKKELDMRIDEAIFIFKNKPKNHASLVLKDLTDYDEISVNNFKSVSLPNKDAPPTTYNIDDLPIGNTVHDGDGIYLIIKGISKTNPKEIK